jgi:hypothetical protein
MKKVFWIHTLTLSSILVMLPFLLSAQRQKPSERRVSDKDKKVKKEIFADDDPNFKVTTIPEKWNKSSAVIINQKFEYTYMRDNKGINYDEKVRRRVKLIDKASLEEFSYFFYTKGENNSVGIQIIKPSGKVIEVNTDDAVEVEENIPDIFRAIYTYRDKYMKLAVPDLEEGDIVDYYYYTHYYYPDYAVLPYRSFQDFRFVMASTYPVMNQELKFIVDRGFFINFASLNGAPELSAGAPTKDKAGRIRNIIKTYIIADKDRDKIEKERWSYTLRERPFIKFQVTYTSRKYADDAGEFLGEIDEPKTKITNDEVQEKIGKRLLQATDYAIYADDIMKYLKKTMPTETNPEKIARATFYAFRYQVLNGYYNNPYGGGSDKQVSVRLITFVTTLMEVFDRKKIDYELAVTMDRDEGSTDQLLFTDEVRLCVKVKGAKPFYMFPFNNFSTFDQTDPDLEGAEAIVFKPEKNSRKVTFSKSTIPYSKPEQNIAAYTTDITLADPFENIGLERKSSFIGNMKYGESLPALYDKDYLKDDMKKYDPSAARSTASHERTRSGQKEKSQKENQSKENLEKANDYRKKQLEEDFDIVTYDEYELLKEGRFDETPALEYREKFTIKGIINKAGKNYLIDVGKIIGGQIEIKEDEVKRETNINYGFARTINNTITITLPAGYTVDGLNDLNMNIDNDAMTFKSTAKLDGGKLVITTSKVYKKASDKKENWNKWVDVLEAAYKFTQKKIVLKKSA